MPQKNSITVVLTPIERKALEAETARRGMRAMSELVRSVLYREIPTMGGRQ